MEKELLDKQELSAKLGKEATLLATNVDTAKVVFNSYNELKKLLTGVVEKSKEVEKLKGLCEKYLARTKELSKQKQEQYDTLDDVKKSAYTYSQNLSKIKEEKQKKQDVVDKLKAILSSIDNEDIKKGFVEETKKLNALTESETECVSDYETANNIVKVETQKFSSICYEIAKLSKAQTETLEKIRDLTKEVNADNERIVGLQNRSNVSVDLIDIIVETAKKIGYYNALVSSGVSSESKVDDTKNVEKAIKEVVTKKEVPTFTVDLLKELYLRVLKSDETIADNRDRLVIELKNLDSLDKEFKLLDVFFDDYIDNPVMLEDKDKVPYISANRQGTAYSQLQHMKYDATGDKKYPPVSRAFSYVISGLKAIHKITDIDIMNRMNGIGKDAEKKIEYASIVESNPQYKLYNKKSGYVVLAVSDTRLLAIPKADYSLTFIAELAESYGHSLKCVCKKGGKIGNDR